MIFDCHMHTYLCGHAQGRPEQYVAQASKLGIELITFTCHVPIDGHGFLQEGIRMSHDQLPLYRSLVERARNFGQPLGVKVLYGIEAEIFPEEQQLAGMKALLTTEPFDFVLGSLHHSLPIFRRWLQKRNLTDDPEIINAYFETLTYAATTGLYHSIAHPDVIRIYGTVKAFEPSDHEKVIKQFLYSLVAQGICMEVNTSGLTKGVYKLHPDPQILEWAKSIGVQLTLGSDSHHPNQVGQFFPDVVNLLKDLGFESISYFNKGNQMTVEMCEVLQRL